MKKLHKYFALSILLWMPIALMAHPEPKKEDAMFVELASILSSPKIYNNQYIKTKGYFLYSENSKQFVLGRSNTVELSPEVLINNEVLTLASAEFFDKTNESENMSFVGNEISVYGSVNVWGYDPIIIVLGEVKLEK